MHAPDMAKKNTNRKLVPPYRKLGSRKQCIVECHRSKFGPSTWAIYSEPTVVMAKFGLLNEHTFTKYGPKKLNRKLVVFGHSVPYTCSEYSVRSAKQKVWSHGSKIVLRAKRTKIGLSVLLTEHKYLSKTITTWKLYCKRWSSGIWFWFWEDKFRIWNNGKSIS